MNFLSHFYFDGKAGNPYFNLGLVLPDLTGMVKRGWKIGERELTDPKIADYEQLAKGIRYHLQMDEFFHKSDFFVACNELIKSELKTLGIQYPPYRLFFITHVFLELLMDRLLVKFKPSTVKNFYKELSNIDLSRIEQFFSMLTTPFYEAFNDFYRKFLDDQFLYEYPDDNRFLEALNRIFQRVRQPLFYEEQKSIIRSRLNALEVYIFRKFDLLEDEMEKYKVHATS